MRKVAFVLNDEHVKKIMLYETSDGTYLFGYDSLYDTGCAFDYWFTDLSDAESTCEEDYGIDKADWILISDPYRFCQHDLIMPIKVKGREDGKPQWGSCEILLDGNWVDYELKFDKSHPLMELPDNDKLLFSGFSGEFEQAKKQDKAKAKKILELLQFDRELIGKML